MTVDTSVAKHAAQLAERAGEVALCLDFDGTLSPTWTTQRRPGPCGASSSSSRNASRQIHSLGGRNKDHPPAYEMARELRRAG
jgi:hypothetical protein